MKVTVRPATPVPAAGSSVDNTPDNVTDCPFTADVAPVYDRAVSSCVTTKSADPLLAKNSLSPANDADRVYVPAASPGVRLHEAVPDPSVVPVQVSAPFKVNTTGLPPTGADVSEFVQPPPTPSWRPHGHQSRRSPPTQSAPQWSAAYRR